MSADTTLTANFEIVYTLTVNAGAGGSVLGGGTYSSGSQVNLSATPDTGYAFVDWSDGSTEQSRTITLSADTTLTANFEIETYTFVLGSDGEGYVSQSLYCCNFPDTYTWTYEYGTQIEISATPFNHRVFTSWSDGSTEQTRTITITQDTTLTANFELVSYTFTLIAGDGGLVNQAARPLNNGQYSDADLTTGASATSSVTYPYGTYIDIEAQPNIGYYFNGWAPSNYSAPLLTGDASDSRRRTTVVGDETLTANFAQDSSTYAVTVFVQGGGSVQWESRINNGTYTGGETHTTNGYLRNDEITLTAVPDSGSSFLEWQCNSGCSGNTFGSNETLVLTIGSSIAITARFQ